MSPSLERERERGCSQGCPFAIPAGSRWVLARMGRCLWHAMSVVSRFARPVWSLNSRREEKSASDVVLAMTVNVAYHCRSVPLLS